MDFLKNSKRFSFKLDGVNIWKTEYKCEVSEKNNELTTVYYFKDGIKVTNIAKKYAEFDAYEWGNYIENTSDMPTGIISELRDCDCELPMEYEDIRRWSATLSDPETTTKILAPTGSTCVEDEFSTAPDLVEVNKRVNHFFAGETRNYENGSGCSSDIHAPFFNIHKNGAGYIVAVGWTGNWNCQFTRNHESLAVCSKVGDTNFRIMPGEAFRTSSVVIMMYNADIVESQNKWRRLVKTHFSLVGSEGRDKYAPLCTMIWGGMKTDKVLDRVRKIDENNLPFEYVWMDAGWYGVKTQPTPDEFEGDWPRHVGDWRVSPNTHPQGLKDVAEAIRNTGKKFLLWFEPERAVYTTPMAVEHPEYFLSGNDAGDYNRLLNLGNPDALKYCIDTVCGIVEELQIAFYRQDCNIEPVEYWRRYDAPDRKGITEIKYVNGLYTFLDTLLERFPHIMIDNCAGGGRRIDIEMLKRSIPLWRSDYQCAANHHIEATQCHHINFNTWMTYSGTGTGRVFDEYRVRSTYDAALATGWLYAAACDEFVNDTEKMKLIHKYTTEYLKVRQYFSEDMYPLTEPSMNSDIWCAVQFNRPDENDGIVQVFRRDNAPYETASFSLRGLDVTCNYQFTDIDGGEFEISGKELLHDGFKVTIPQKHKAKIYMYKAI